MNNEEKFEVKHKESTDTNNIKIDGKSMMSIENNLISRKKVKIKTLRRLNLDVPDDLVKKPVLNPNQEIKCLKVMEN